jgi:hypothetical protein
MGLPVAVILDDLLPSGQQLCCALVSIRQDRLVTPATERPKVAGSNTLEITRENYDANTVEQRGYQVRSLSKGLSPRVALGKLSLPEDLPDVLFIAPLFTGK